MRVEVSGTRCDSINGLRGKHRGGYPGTPPAQLASEAEESRGYGVSDPGDWELEGAQDAYFEELYRQHYDEAISEFTNERLQSFFIANPTAPRPPIYLLREARAIQASCPSGCVALGASASNVAIKNLYLRPLVHGLVHSTTAASLIAELTISQMGIGRFRKLLTQIMKDIAAVDLRTFARSGASQALLDELRSVQDTRNRVLHRGEAATACEAELAVAVAACILEDLFPALARGLGFHLHEDSRLCSEPSRRCGSRTS